jgi:hypothetical protein
MTAVVIAGAAAAAAQPEARGLMPLRPASTGSAQRSARLHRSQSISRSTPHSETDTPAAAATVAVAIPPKKLHQQQQKKATPREGGKGGEKPQKAKPSSSSNNKTRDKEEEDEDGVGTASESEEEDSDTERATGTRPPAQADSVSAGLLRGAAAVDGGGADNEDEEEATTRESMRSKKRCCGGVCACLSFCKEHGCGPCGVMAHGFSLLFEPARRTQQCPLFIVILLVTASFFLLQDIDRHIASLGTPGSSIFAMFFVLGCITLAVVLRTMCWKRITASKSEDSTIDNT